MHSFLLFLFSIIFKYVLIVQCSANPWYYLGGTKELLKWAADTYVEYKPEDLYIAMAEEAYKEHLESTGVRKYKPDIV